MATTVPQNMLVAHRLFLMLSALILIMFFFSKCSVIVAAGDSPDCAHLSRARLRQYDSLDVRKRGGALGSKGHIPVTKAA
jgi:hypothetical protein